MEEKKLNSLITTLLKIAEESGNPMKYNQVILDLLKADEYVNVNIMNHKGYPVIVFINKEGGISMIGNE